MGKKTLKAAGIDVGSKLFHLAIHGEPEVHEFANSEAGRKAIGRFLKKRGPVKVVLESTGVYGLQLALHLVAQNRITVHYVNPMAAKAYAGRGLLPRAKCDRVDALALARMAADDLGKPWAPPPAHVMTLRSMTRRIRVLVKDTTRERNRLAAGKAGETPEAVIVDMEENIAALERRVETLRKAAVAFTVEHADLHEKIELLCSIPGIAEATAVEIVGEIGCMPPDLTPKQLVAQTGLDPRANQSGRRDGPRRISKMGSKYLRATMHMAALNATRWCPEVLAFHRMLHEERKKHVLVARVAVSRKLLHCIHGMLKTGAPFDPSKFYNPPGETEHALKGV